MKMFLRQDKKRTGFTLAEVLITLGIIGVVAAITIPILMQNAGERANIVAAKKTFSILSSAYTMAVKDNGTPDNWGLVSGVHAPSLTMIEPYLKVDKDCTAAGAKGCFPTGGEYKGLGKNSMAQVIDDNTLPSIRLTDGTMINAFIPFDGVHTPCNTNYGIDANAPQSLQHICAEYRVDTNGAKKPNQYGKDTFVFYLTTYGIVPSGMKADVYDFASSCNNTDFADGSRCAAWVVYNDNMDYMHCDGINWDTKTKCN